MSNIVNSNIIKSNKFKLNEKPTVSISKSNKSYINKLNYNKLNDNEKLEHDLAKDKENTKNLKSVIRNSGYSYKKLNKYIEKEVGKYDPNITHIKNLVSKGKNLISIRFNEDIYKKQKFTINKIKNISNKLSNYLKNKGVQGKAMTSLKYGNLNWKSGYLRNLGEETKLYDPNDLYNLEVPYEIPKSIQAFDIFILLGNKEAGGLDDKYNDCLYNCLKYYIFDIEKYFKSPANFKKYLGLKRNDMVPVSCIDQIEKKLKNYKINIRGDYIRSSIIQSYKEINIKLKNEHYMIEKLETKSLTPNIKYDEKIPIMYDKKTFEMYDGNTKWISTKEEKNDIIFNHKSPYILINREKQGYDNDGNKIIITIEQEYQQFLVIADTLKKESKGLINLYKSGSYHDAALNLFDRIIKTLNPDNILQDEALWIKNSSFSAIIWCEKYEGELYKYDVKSLYPYLMSQTTLKFPIKRGEFKKIEEINFYPQYGIYRCKINKSSDENINKLFKFNYHNLYTSIDINNAKNLNLEIQLIQDNQPNFLHWTPDKLVTGHFLFSEFVDILFPLKEGKVNKAKNILNILWGALCEVDKRKMYVKDTFRIEEDEEIIEMYPSNDDNGYINIKTVKYNNFYKTNFARICPFLISQGRKHMSDIMLPHINHIHRIQTDSFDIDIKIHDNKIVGLGELKYEGYNENAIIKNCVNKIKFHY